jgi:molybdopterin synthase sulfur carrier subunit
MAVKVKIPTILRRHVGGAAEVEGRGGTVLDLLQDLERRYPGITGGILNPEGGLHRFVNLYVNGEDVRYLGALETEVNEGDTVSILPAVAGGSSLCDTMSIGWVRRSNILVQTRPFPSAPFLPRRNQATLASLSLEPARAVCQEAL